MADNNNTRPNTDIQPATQPYDPTNKSNHSTTDKTDVADNSGSMNPDPDHYEANDPNKAANPTAHAGPIAPTQD
jgi:hypothetical protein